MGIRKARAAETEAALKQAAREQFATRGYLNTKITDITAAAGRATGSFYEHFASKEQLLQSLEADMYAAAHDQLADAPHPAHDLTDREQLRAHLAVAWRLVRDNRAVAAALFESGIAAGNADGGLWNRLIGDTRVLREHLEHSQTLGRALPGPPEVVAAALGTALSMLAYALPEPSRSPYDDDQVLDTLIALLADGLCRPAS